LRRLAEQLKSDEESNAGAMFCELAGEQNREALASPSRRKPTRGAADSSRAHQKTCSQERVFAS
jgi:hypothetical protein